MRIVDVAPSDMRRAQRRSRGRSRETLQLIEAIDSLGAGKAKALVPEPGEDPKKLRAKLNYAAKIAGKKLQVAVEGNRVVFARGRGRPRRRS